MGPVITLYILGGCVAVAAGLFIVMIVLTAMRPPQLPDLSIPPPAPLQRMIRALTPVPIVAAQRNVQTQRVVRPPVVPAPVVRPPVVLPPVPVTQPPPRVIRRPIYPARRSRPLLRFVVGVLVTSVLATGAVVAYPAMLDPLCDNYEWFGADSAHVVRQYARDAHAAIADFIATL
jgi:hypothetical protein